MLEPTAHLPLRLPSLLDREVEGSEAAGPAAVVVIVVTKFTVDPASVTALGATVARLFLGAVKPDERSNITEP